MAKNKKKGKQRETGINMKKKIRIIFPIGMDLGLLMLTTNMIGVKKTTRIT